MINLTSVLYVHKDHYNNIEYYTAQGIQSQHGVMEGIPLKKKGKTKTCKFNSLYMYFI